MYLKVLGFVSIILLLSNCANMNKSDCLTANWQLIGFEDGSLGKNESQISQHRKECSEHGVTPDLSAYRKGHFEGSKLFCTTNNGFTRGSQGKELDWLEHTIAEKSELMIADGLNRKQRIVVRDEIAQYQQQQVELYDLLSELKYEFENAHQAYEQGKDAFSGY